MTSFVTKPCIYSGRFQDALFPQTNTMKLNLDYTVYKGHHDGRVVKSQGHREELAPDEVLLRITHAGLCGTDEHYKTADMVLGHEGVGVVEKLGCKVDTFKVYVPSLSRLAMTLTLNQRGSRRLGLPS